MQNWGYLPIRITLRTYDLSDSIHLLTLRSQRSLDTSGSQRAKSLRLTWIRPWQRPKKGGLQSSSEPDGYTKPQHNLRFA